MATLWSLQSSFINFCDMTGIKSNTWIVATPDICGPQFCLTVGSNSLSASEGSVVQLLGMFSSSNLKAAPFWKWLVCLEHQISLFLGWIVNCSSTGQYSFASILL